MKVNRRDFLKIGGGAGVAVALGGGFYRWTQFPPVEKGLEPGVERWVPTVCGQCMGGCGILARVIDGWAVNIAGNPLHPVNRGTLCPKGIAGLQGLYDPDRIRSPLKRSGKRGEGRWQPISWEEALSTVTESLKKLRQNGEPHRLAVLGGRYRGLMRSLWERFMEAFGSPNYIDNQFQWEGPAVEGLYLTQGIFAPPAYDFENTRYILSFGSDLLESYWSPVQALSAYGQFRRGRPEQRGKLVQIEPRLSVTGIKADEWIPTPPGTEGLVALAIANMIIREALYNQEFHREPCRSGLKTGQTPVEKNISVLKNSFFRNTCLTPSPNRLEFLWIPSSGWPGNLLPINLPLLSGIEIDPFTRWPISILNGLVGNIDASGGVLIPRTVPLQALPSFGKDAIAQKGLQAERIDGEKKPSLMLQQPYLFAEKCDFRKTLSSGGSLSLLHESSLFKPESGPLFSKPSAEIPLIVSFSPYMDDTTSFADLVLPDQTPLERWQDDPVFLNNGFPVLGIRQPVIEPLYQTKATGDVLLQISKSLGGEIQKAFPWNDFREVLLYGIRGVFDAKRGDTFGLQFEQSWTRLLERGGWWAPSYKTFDEFWKQLQEKGGWWDPVYDFREWDRVFRTPSKKFQFYAQTLEQALPGDCIKRDKEASPSSPTGRNRQRGSDEKAYPFHLHIFRTMALTGSRNANQPWLQAIFGEYLFERWETWVEINPETATGLGSPTGIGYGWNHPKERSRVRARLYKGAMPDVVSIPWGEGHQAGGRWARGIGENPYRLLGDDLDPLTGYPISGSTRVKIYKA